MAGAGQRCAQPFDALRACGDQGPLWLGSGLAKTKDRTKWKSCRRTRRYIGESCARSMVLKDSTAAERQLM